MTAILKRELRSYYSGMMGWLLDAFFVLIGGLYYLSINLQSGSTWFTYTLYSTCFVFLIFVPVLTMRSFAEERRTKTDQLLLTSPVSLWGVVLGKFLACFVVFAIPVAILSVCPLLMLLGGSFSNAANYFCILAYLLLGAASIAIGLFVSALTENQIIAVLGSFAVMMVTYLMPGIRSMFTEGSTAAFILFVVLLIVLSLVIGISARSLTVGCMVFVVGGVALLALFKMRSALLVSAFSGLLGYFSLFEPFQQFVNSIVDVTALIYYVTVAVLFLFLTVQTLNKRRYAE